MTAVLALVAPYVLPAIGSTIAAALTWGTTHLLAALAAKTRDQRKLALLDALATAADTAVKATAQTVVSKLKAANAWGSPASYSQALSAALATLETQASSILPALAAQGVDVGADALRQLIEAKLAQFKLGTP